MPWVLGLVVVLGAAVPRAQPETTPPLAAAEGQRFAETLDAIVGYSGAPGSPPRTIVLTERGINAYLRFQAADLLPPVVGEPRMRLLGDGRLSARALIDLDRLRAERPRGPLDPLRYLGGQVEVVAVGALRASAGVGQFEIESVHVETVPVPVVLLVEAVRAYRGSGGFDLTAPFRLPYGIEELRVETARAIVVQ
ncbi:MAG: hypothetical protein OXH04_13205 [Acidobacteria bacterium]|nr:hypothetical protein [Acidobacteriota bacterium]